MEFLRLSLVLRPNEGQSVRAIAILLNVLLIGTVIYLVSTGGETRGKDLALAALFLATPIANLLAFYFSGGESWL